LLEIPGSVGVIFGFFSEKPDAGIESGSFEMPGRDQAVAAVVALAAKHDDAEIGGRPAEAQYRVGDVFAGGFHELQAGNFPALYGEAIDFAHFRCGKGFHGRLW
jgi:hypothetical protein